MRTRAGLVLALVAALGFAPAAPPQEIRRETSAVNVGIPVRVFQGGRFVDDLVLADFELAEDGRPQTIEAFYLVKKTIIERREEQKEFAPRTARHFFLFFEVGDYDPKISEALNYFVKTVLLPGDNLTLVTPMKTYRMKGELFGLVGRERTYAQIIGLLRRDIQIGYSESRAILAEMTDLALVMASEIRSRDVVADPGLLVATDPTAVAPAESAYGGSFEEKLMHYATLLSRLDGLRVVDENKLLAFANRLKDIDGQKGVFLFYQREAVPKIDPRLVDMLTSRFNQRPDITQSLNAIFGLDTREVALDVGNITRAFADSSASLHFLHIVRPFETAAGIRMDERSDDVFGPFREMARATGGTVAATANIAAAMRSAVAGWENYYLLYYSPAGYKPDGRFHSVTVKVKNGGYKVSHRLGYIAD